MTIATRTKNDKDLNRFERGILKNIQKFGWHANGIPGEGTSPAWASSVGLFAKYETGSFEPGSHDMPGFYGSSFLTTKKHGRHEKIRAFVRAFRVFRGSRDSRKTLQRPPQKERFYKQKIILRDVVRLNCIDIPENRFGPVR